MNQAQLWLTIGAINGGVTVALGAFGAHGLKNRVSARAARQLAHRH